MDWVETFYVLENLKLFISFLWYSARFFLFLDPDPSEIIIDPDPLLNFIYPTNEKNYWNEELKFRFAKKLFWLNLSFAKRTEIGLFLVQNKISQNTILLFCIYTVFPQNKMLNENGNPVTIFQETDYHGLKGWSVATSEAARVMRLHPLLLLLLVNTSCTLLFSFKDSSRWLFPVTDMDIK